MPDVKSLEDRFLEVEKRVQAAVAENARLRQRVKELELELARIRRESQDLQHFHGKRMHVREKIERILKALETAGDQE